MNKYRIHPVMTAAALIAFICSCSIDERVSLPLHSECGQEICISFTGDPMAELRVGTKASDPKGEEEKAVNQLYVFFFGNDGEYLRGGYLTGYDNAPDDGGFYAPGVGVTMLKIANDNENFENPTLAEGATIYALANMDLDQSYLTDSDGDGRPDYFKDLKSLEDFVYSPASGISLGLPEKGMPMVGKKVLNLAGNNITPERERTIELRALMARVDVSIRLSSSVSEGNLPSMTLVGWTANNVPSKVPFTEPVITTDASPVNIHTTMQRTIYNNNGAIDFSFYMFENLQDTKDLSEVQWPDGTNIDSETGYPDGVYDQKQGIDHRQRYKPLLGEDTANSASVELHAFYSTYNDDGKGSATYEVRYTLFLGSNHVNNFQVKRNHQYKNDITIKGLTQVGNNPDHITFDARVDITEGGNEFYIAILRERNHDAHFCVTPMDVYMFADNTLMPSIEVILGKVPDGSEEPDQTTVPDWIRMERIDARDMESGTDFKYSRDANGNLFTVYSNNNIGGTHLTAGAPWTAGNGKRAFFTTDLFPTDMSLSQLKTKETVSNSRDRIYFYINENLTMQEREAIVTIIYKEKGVEVKRRTLILKQVPLIPVLVYDRNDDGDRTTIRDTIYMEQYEEYLDHYDPLDEHRTDQIYDGLPWAEQNTTLASLEIPTLRYQSGSIFGIPIHENYEVPDENYYTGLNYTSFIIDLAGQDVITLNGTPMSAFQYCHNKNIRNSNHIVPAEYESNTEKFTNCKWFLPGIRQMEDALYFSYASFNEFQNYFYWSSSAGKYRTWLSSYEQDKTKARATKYLIEVNDYAESGGDAEDNFTSHSGTGGRADRTEILRIRAFRIDLEPYDY